MKPKINKRTIETILWLLGQLITLIREVAKNNKGTKDGEDLFKTANNVNILRKQFLTLKIYNELTGYGKEENKQNTKGN